MDQKIEERVAELRKVSSELFLPKNVKPTFYDIWLMPNFSDFTFRGRAEVAVEVLENTDFIMLHAHELEISKAEVHFSGLCYRTSYPVRIEMDKENKKAILIFSEKLQLGPAGKLVIQFTGILNDKMAGFYRSNYVVNGETKVMASTQFEDTAARQAFPCWDEPNIKARYKVSLEIPQNLEALSNTPVEAVLQVASTKRVVFKTTPLMSVYLVAFCVGEFEYLEARTSRGIPVRAYTTPGKKHLAEFALSVATRTIDFYEEYFDEPYMGEKLDMIAIPDFAAGAMENVGLVTYREIRLFVDPLETSLVTKRAVANVVAHELAHQWFGNLVTMDWWDELWLNEAFASFISYLAVDELSPEWRVWESFVEDEYGAALIADALRSTHPVEMPVKSKDDIGQNFDAISYDKGASILRMLHEYLGAPVFRDGLRLYIKRHKFANAKTEDLWNALEEASGRPVRVMMDTWVRQSGYPVIVADRGLINSYFLEQKRFLNSGEKLTTEESSQKWHANVSYQSSFGVKGNLVLTEKQDSILLSPAERWVNCNVDRVGFYRVLYGRDDLEAMKSEVKSFSVNDRWGLLDDLYALVRNGAASAPQLMSFMEAFKSEREYIVWANLCRNLGALELLFVHDREALKKFHLFAQDLLGGVAEDVGWDAATGEDVTRTLLRPVILSAYGHFGAPTAIREARRRFKLHFVDKEPIHPDLRSVVYLTVARHGRQNTYQTFRNRFCAENNPEEKVRIIQALGAFPQRDALSKTLAFGLSKEVRLQDFMFVMRSLTSSPNRYAGTMAWNFAKDNWGGYKEKV